MPLAGMEPDVMLWKIVLVVPTKANVRIVSDAIILLDTYTKRSVYKGIKSHAQEYSQQCYFY